MTTSKQNWSEGPPSIVFYGGAGAGKTTAAAYLEDKHGYNRISFATPLKDVAQQIWGPSAATDRDKLQKLGVAVREIDEDAWANLMLDEVETVHRYDPGRGIVNDDCRFPNEYWRLKEAGFYFVRVLANEAKRVDRLLRIGKLDDHSQLQHASETALVGLAATKEGITDDFTVFNNDDPAAFYQDIENVLYSIQEQT